MKHTKGFTLMEIMIVMVIMGILSLIGISTFFSAQKKARDSKRKGDLSNVVKSLESYVNDVGSYPDMGENGTIFGCDGGTAECPWGFTFSETKGNVMVSLSPEQGGGEEIQSLDTTYMKSLPTDPSPTLYRYWYEAYKENGIVKGYRIYARLENLMDPDITAVAYNINCSADVGTTVYCNYMIGSANAPDPTPYLLPTLTPTLTPTPACLADGSACTSNGQCCGGVCTTYYRDEDGDGYGTSLSPYSTCGSSLPSGYVTNNMDCYDGNANAKPGQTTCYAEDRGDGSYDYDCNGTGSTTGCTACYGLAPWQQWYCALPYPNCPHTILLDGEPAWTTCGQSGGYTFGGTAICYWTRTYCLDESAPSTGWLAGTSCSATCK